LRVEALTVVHSTTAHNFNDVGWRRLAPLAHDLRCLILAVARRFRLLTTASVGAGCAHVVQDTSLTAE
jgi:predicted neutral ceramidase superfamily lipid hydrolase